MPFFYSNQSGSKVYQGINTTFIIQIADIPTGTLYGAIRQAYFQVNTPAEGQVNCYCLCPGTINTSPVVFVPNIGDPNASNQQFGTHLPLTPEQQIFFALTPAAPLQLIFAGQSATTGAPASPGTQIVFNVEVVFYSSLAFSSPTIQNVNIQQTGGIAVNTSTGYVNSNIQNLPLDTNGNIKMDIEDFKGAPVSSSNQINVTPPTFPSLQNVNIQQTGGIAVNTSTGYVNSNIQNLPLDTNGNIKMDIEDFQGAPVSSSNQIIVTNPTFPSIQNVNIQQTGGIAVNTSTGYVNSNIQNLPLDGNGNIRIDMEDFKGAPISSSNQINVIPPSLSISNFPSTQNVNIKQSGGIAIDTTSGFINTTIDNFPSLQNVNVTNTNSISTTITSSQASPVYVYP